MTMLSIYFQGTEVLILKVFLSYVSDSDLIYKAYMQNDEYFWGLAPRGKQIQKIIPKSIWSM